MRKNAFILYISYSILFLMVRCSNSSTNITVGCASNMQVAMDSIIDAYKLETGKNIDLICHSSGMLYSQINLGAPIDLYISANPDYSQNLFKQDKCTSPIPFAEGQLIMAYQKNIEISTLKELINNTNVKTLAIPNFETAPYGASAKNHLKSLGLYSDFFDKMIVGESIAQVSQYLETNVVDAGFVSNTFMRINGDSYNYQFITLNDPTELTHCVSQIKKESRINEETTPFIKFLSSQKSKDILSHFGYKPL